MIRSIEELMERNTRCYSIEKLEQRLKPWIADPEHENASGEGFIGKDEKLIEVIKKDHDKLIELGTDYEELAKIAENVLKKNRNTDNTYNNGFYFFHVHSFRFQNCPFGCPEGLDKNNHHTSSSTKTFILTPQGLEDQGEFLRKNRQNYRETTYKFNHLTISGLMPHLISEHGFFEGMTVYRTDPEKLWTFKDFNKK